MKYNFVTFTLFLSLTLTQAQKTGFLIKKFKKARDENKEGPSLTYSNN